MRGGGFEHDGFKGYHQHVSNNYVLNQDTISLKYLRKGGVSHQQAMFCRDYPKPGGDPSLRPPTNTPTPTPLLGLYMYKSPPPIRSPWGMDNLALLEGWPLMEGISDPVIHGSFSEIVALLEGWPLVSVATYRGTTVYVYTFI